MYAGTAIVCGCLAAPVIWTGTSLAASRAIFTKADESSNFIRSNIFFSTSFKFNPSTFIGTNLGKTIDPATDT